MREGRKSDHGRLSATKMGLCHDDMTGDNRRSKPTLVGVGYRIGGVQHDLNNGNECVVVVIGIGVESGAGRGLIASKNLNDRGCALRRSSTRSIVLELA